MKTIVKIILASLFFVSCQGEIKQDSDANTSVENQEINPSMISCEAIGLVKVSYSKKDLVEQFTEAELRDDTRTIRNVERSITVVFPNKPEEVIVVWADDTKEKVSELIIWDENGPYSTKEGLRVGISLRDVVKLNNYLSVDFTNFYSSMDGYANITGFNGGELEEKYPCLGGRLDIVRLKGVDKLTLDEFKTQDTVRSSDAMMQHIEVKITEILIRNLHLNE